MKMVYETRRVVEDYILYKIEQNTTMSTANGENSSSTQSLHRFPTSDYARFPLPQEPPSKINDAVRKVAADFEERYRARYPDLLEGIRANHTASCNIDKVFVKICKDLFQIPINVNPVKATTSSHSSGSRKSKTPSPASVESESGAVGSRLDVGRFDDSQIKWGHVIGLLVFAGILAVRSVEIHSNEQVDEIVNWVSQFFDSELDSWMRRHGGWHGLAEWCGQNKGATVSGWFDQGQSLKTVLRVSGAVAAVALGAVMFSRK